MCTWYDLIFGIFDYVHGKKSLHSNQENCDHQKISQIVIVLQEKNQ